MFAILSHIVAMFYAFRVYFYAFDNLFSEIELVSQRPRAKHDKTKKVTVQSVLLAADNDPDYCFEIPE